MKLLKRQSSVNTVILIVALSLSAKLVGFARDAFIGYRFGAGTESDTYFSAIGITTIIFLGIGSGIATNIIPLVVRAKKDNQLRQSISQIFSWIMVLGVLIGGLFYIGAPSVLRLLVAGYSESKLLDTALLMRVMMPTILLITVMYFFVGVLQANEKFVLPAIASFPANFLFFLYLGVAVGKFGIVGLAVTTLLGWVIQLFIVMPTALSEKLIDLRQFRFKMDGETKRFFLGIIPIILITLTHQFNILLDNQSASFYGEGNVSAIYFGNMLFTAITTVTVYGITAVMFPKFNHKYLDNDLDSFYQTVVNVLRSVALLLVPMSVGLIVLGPYVIKLVFENGVFDAQDTATTILTFTGYTSFMLAFGMIDVLNKAFYTMNNRHTPLMVGGIITVSNIVLTFTLTKWIGFSGIPIGTAIAFYIGAIISFILFYQKNKQMNIRLMLDTLIKSLIAAIVMGITIKVLDELLTKMMTDSLITSLGIIAIDMVIGVITYGVLLVVLKEKLIVHRFKMLIKKVKRNA